MITKLRNILGLSTLEENLTRYQDLSEDMENINSQTDTLADMYYSRMRNYNEILKSSEYSDEIKNSVQTRFDAFLIDQKASVVGLVNRRHKVQKELSKLLKNDNLSKAVQELTAIEKAKDNYKQNKISKNVYNDIIKAKKGKVHYSDNFVFWNGKLLIIQRVSDDESANTWVLPGGHVDAGEGHEEAAIRELQEETGIECENPVLAGKYDNDDVMIEYYTTNIESETEPSILLDTSEHQSYKWIDVNKELDNYEFPFSMKENIEKILLPEKQKEVKILKAVTMFIGGQISKDVLSEIIKARSGIYSNTSENRKLGRVGQKYGVKKEEVESDNETISKEDKEKNFKEWFGDSKVVDSDGNPLVVYHGTKGDFKEFDNKKIGTLNDDGISGKGFYFTPIYNIAKNYSEDGNVLSVYLNIKKPFLKDQNSNEWKNNHKKYFMNKMPEETTNLLKKDGYDGVFEVRRGQIKEINVFNSNQIKSATGNKGAFDPKSNDITKSITLFTQGLISKQVLSDIVKANKDKIKGGLADNKTIEDIAKRHKVSDKHIQSQIEMGIDVEIEHTKDKNKAKEIAMDHLMESPDYYTKLAEMEDSFEKSRAGRYSDNATNRRLKRVGQQYGTKGTQDTPEPKDGKKEPETDEKQDKDIPIEDHAKQSSETALQNAAKGGGEELRIAAKKELDRREKEDSVKEDEVGSKESNKEEKPKEDNKDHDSQIKELENKIKELRGADIDYSDEKALEKNTKQVQEAMKRRKELVDERDSLRKVGFEEYKKGFKDFSSLNNLSEDTISKEFDEKINDIFLKIKDSDDKDELIDEVNKLKKEKIDKIDELEYLKARKNQEKLDFYKTGSESVYNYLKENKDAEIAVNTYVSNGYIAIRNYLSNPESYKKENVGSSMDEDDVVKISKDLSSFISKNKIKDNLVLNRRVKGDKAIEFFNSLSKGEMYEDKSFSSTSLDELTNFGDYSIQILAKKGSRVSNVGNLGEMEYLIDKGAKFRVLDKGENSLIVELL